MSGVNRSGAIKKTRVAQVAGLALIALTAGAVIYTPELPKAQSQQPDGFYGIDPNGEQANQSKPKQERYAMDSDEASRIGDIFQSVSKVEKPRVITPKPTPNDPEQTETVIAEADGWKYLGGVFEPSINFALVEINGSQRMLKEGMKLADLNAEVISVEEGKIEINRNGKREQITLAKSNGALVSVSDATEQGAKATIIAPGQQAERDYLSARERQTLGTDADKRAAEFERRKRERENRLIGIDR